MTVELLASPLTRRKAVLDTCAVFKSKLWRNQFMGRVDGWLGDDGIAVLPARVIAEIAHVAAKKRVDKRVSAAEKAAVAARAALALKHPTKLVGLDEVRRAVLTRADVDALCRDNADLDLIRQEWRMVDRETKEYGWKTVPGDADFEIAHTVRVLTGADHEAVLVTRDGDLKDASVRLGVALLGRPAPPSRPAAGSGAAGVPLPEPGSGRGIRLLGARAAERLLSDGRLPPLGSTGDTAVVLSSTLVLAAQEAALRAAKNAEKRPAGLADVQGRLERLIATGRVAENQVPVHLLATPWEVYELLARRVVDRRFAEDDDHRPWDMHTLLVLSAAQVLGDDGQLVHLVDGSYGGEAKLVAGARCWRTAGALEALVGASELRNGTVHEVALPKPGGDVDMSALLRKFGDHR